MISDALRLAIEALHQAIADDPDPAHKQVLATCLSNLMKVQADKHKAASEGGARGAVVNRLQGQSY